jgi:hypothetical protein
VEGIEQEAMACRISSIHVLRFPRKAAPKTDTRKATDRLSLRPSFKSRLMPRLGEPLKPLRPVTRAPRFGIRVAVYWKFRDR